MEKYDFCLLGTITKINLKFIKINFNADDAFGLIVLPNTSIFIMEMMVCWWYNVNASLQWKCHMKWIIMLSLRDDRQTKDRRGLQQLVQISFLTPCLRFTIQTKHTETILNEFSGLKSLWRWSFATCEVSRKEKNVAEMVV